MRNGAGSQAIADYCRDKCGVVLGRGLGAHEGKAFRIAHMGHVNAPMIFGTLGVVEMALAALNVPHGRGGAQAAVEFWRRPCRPECRTPPTCRRSGDGPQTGRRCLGASRDASMNDVRSSPRAILFDLDDTILSAYGRPEPAWLAVAEEFASQLAPLSPLEAVTEIMAQSRIFWADPEDHRYWRMRLFAARRETVARALKRSIPSKPLGPRS